jgi:hypothetical protein
MWEFEALAEMSVELVAASEWPLAEKRIAYAAIYQMVGGFDVSFIHFRNAAPLIEAGFFHRIDVTDHPDYAQRKAYFDALVAAQDGEWVTSVPKNPEEHPDYEAIYDPDPHGGFQSGLWFDTSMALWPKAVNAGLLTGLAAEPVQHGSTKDTIAKLMTLAAKSGAKYGGLLKMLHGFTVHALLYDEDSPKAGDPVLAPIVALPALKTALNTPQEDWIDQRFDARLDAEFMNDAEKAFIAWWCAPYETPLTSGN